MVGNNITTDRIFRLKIPLYNADSQTPNGFRFFFPDTPELDKYIIRGIEGHLAPNVTLGTDGDLRDNVQNTGLVAKTLLEDLAKYVYVTISGDSLEEKNFYIPLFSLFNLNTPGIAKTKRIKAYFGKIKTRNCYCIVPANSPLTIQGNYVVNLSFFY